MEKEKTKTFLGGYQLLVQKDAQNNCAGKNSHKN
jgi:hypothetical protein